MKFRYRKLHGHQAIWIDGPFDLKGLIHYTKANAPGRSELFITFDKGKKDLFSLDLKAPRFRWYHKFKHQLWILRYWKDHWDRRFLLREWENKPCSSPERCGKWGRGGKILCTRCYNVNLLYNPQGWSCYPGDTCPHGQYVGGCGIDWMCGACESGQMTYPIHDWKSRLSSETTWELPEYILDGEY